MKHEKHQKSSGEKEAGNEKEEVERINDTQLSIHFRIKMAIKPVKVCWFWCQAHWANGNCNYIQSSSGSCQLNVYPGLNMCFVWIRSFSVKTFIHCHRFGPPVSLPLFRSIHNSNCVCVCALVLSLTWIIVVNTCAVVHDNNCCLYNIGFYGLTPK